MFKCGNCKMERNSGDEVYFVEDTSFCNYIPTCSKECAEIIKQREIKEMENRLNKLKNSEIKREIW